jgi:hypothetical protein
MMKNRQLKFIGLLIVAFIFAIACSKDEGSTVTEAIEGGAVFRSQVVTIDLGSTEVSDQAYDGTIAGIDVSLTKTEGNKLIFMVPFEATLGMHDLEIPSLGQTVRYEVKNTVLAGTADEVMDSFTTNLDAFAVTLDDSPAAVNTQNSINSFHAVYDNASAADKTRMATLYQANKVTFDNIILNDFSSITGRNANVTNDDIVLLAKHSYAVYIMAAGALVAIYAPEPVEKALGLAITAAGAYKAYQFFVLIAEDNLNTVTFSADNIMGVNNRSANNAAITFEHNIDKTIGLNSLNRKLITSDSSKTESEVVAFFTVYNKYNYLINLVNDAILWVNDHVMFADFSLIPLEQLPGSSAQVSTTVDAGTFSDINFSLNHPNLSLVSSTLQSNGQLKMKVKIVGTPSSFPIQSDLYYSYSDEFSTFTGKFPIEVSADCSTSTLAVNAAVSGDDAVANVSGGLSPYTYLWSNGATSSSVNNLPVGAYTVEVTDALGCTRTDDFNVGCQNVPTINSATWTCGTNGSIAIDVAFDGGAAGIVYGGGGGWCEPAEMCYPVRLYFLSPGAADWSIAYNGYSVEMISGDIHGGVVQLRLYHACTDGNVSASLNATYPNYQWRVELMNPCNQRAMMGM